MISDKGHIHTIATNFTITAVYSNKWSCGSNSHLAVETYISFMKYPFYQLTKMRRSVITIGIPILVLATLLPSILSCTNKDVIVLPGVEVREYQGEKLSSINDFRENSIKGPQYIDLESYDLKITGLVEKPKVLSYEQVQDNYDPYKKVVTLRCVEGWSATILWEGVLIKDIIDEAQASPDSTIVIFHAYDGYTTSLPIDYLIDNDIIMAYKMNDLALPPERGAPFQLVAESKWGYKWIKWITEIEVSNDTNYKGYWESRGYSNEGDLDKGFFD